MTSGSFALYTNDRYGQDKTTLTSTDVGSYGASGQSVYNDNVGQAYYTNQGYTGSTAGGQESYTNPAQNSYATSGVGTYNQQQNTNVGSQTTTYGSGATGGTYSTESQGYGSQQQKPYNFAYESADGVGNSHSRQESADANGVVTGSYVIQTADGLYRTVNYVADESGFRASIDSNEPGVDNKDPADVAISHQDPPAGIYNAVQKATYGVSGGGNYQTQQHSYA